MVEILMSKTKQSELKKEQQRERDEGQFNQGRLNADNKWKDAIDERIAELEKQVGIQELRRLKNKTVYRWDL
jgi:hypothetical protein